MKLNPLATELNETLQREAPAVLGLLSKLGQRFYFPRGIISQSAEAKARARRFNATIGIALEEGQPMFLPSVRSLVPDLEPGEHPFLGERSTIAALIPFFPPIIFFDRRSTCVIVSER